MKQMAGHESQAAAGAVLAGLHLRFCQGLLEQLSPSDFHTIEVKLWEGRATLGSLRWVMGETG